MDAIAAAHGVSLPAVALSWLRAQRAVGAPIASARTVAQLEPLFEQAVLSADEVARLSRKRAAA
jgi:aryl-alcohol dehydrogenase-like predicted oxidoreductase